MWRCWAFDMECVLLLLVFSNFDTLSPLDPGCASGGKQAKVCGCQVRIAGLVWVGFSTAAELALIAAAKNSQSRHPIPTSKQPLFCDQLSFINSLV